MIRFPVADLPAGFECVARDTGGYDVIFDVTADSLGEWVRVDVKDGHLQLFNERSYRHRLLAKRLGFEVPDE